MMGRDQEPLRQRRELIVDSEMEEPSTSWEIKTGSEDSWTGER